MRTHIAGQKFSVFVRRLFAAAERVECVGDVIGQGRVRLAAAFGRAQFGECVGPLLCGGEFETEQLVRVRVVCELDSGAILAGGAFMLAVEIGVARAGEARIEAAIVVDEIEGGERAGYGGVSERRGEARAQRVCVLRVRAWTQEAPAA